MSAQTIEYSVDQLIDFAGPVALPRRKSAVNGSYAFLGDDLRAAVIEPKFLQTSLIVEREIQSGASGTVYRVRLGRDSYALKVIPCTIKGGHEDVLFQRILREVRVGQIAHPNLLPIYGVGVVPGGIGVLMELIQGSDLWDLLDREWTLREIALIGSQVADALAKLHGQNLDGVVHRDIKPDNIFVVEVSGQPVHVIVGDFGVARVLDDPRLTQQGIRVGTPHYMAPEQFMGTPSTCAVDIWALAVVLYQLYFQAHPFVSVDETGDQDVLDAMYAVFSRRAGCGIELTAGDPFQDFLTQCFSYDAKARPTAAEAGKVLRGIYRQEYLNPRPVISGIRRSRRPPPVSAAPSEDAHNTPWSTSPFAATGAAKTEIRVPVMTITARPAWPVLVIGAFFSLATFVLTIVALLLALAPFWR